MNRVAADEVWEQFPSDIERMAYVWGVLHSFHDLVEVVRDVGVAGGDLHDVAEEIQARLDAVEVAIETKGGVPITMATLEAEMKR